MLITALPTEHFLLKSTLDLQLKILTLVAKSISLQLKDTDMEKYLVLMCIKLYFLFEVIK